MEARVAVLEEIASSIKSDMREMRADIKDGFREMRSEFKAVREKQENDFRLTFGALIAVALGLAGLVAHALHWV